MEPNLRFPAGFCENLRFPAKICGFLRPPNAGISKSKGEYAKKLAVLCENQCFGLSVTLVPSP